MDLKNVSKKFELLLVPIVLFVYYWSLIKNDPRLNYDDWVILGPLYKTNSISEYFYKIKQVEIFDILPIRDLSHFADIYLKNIWSFYSFHLINVLIWVFILITIKNIIQKYFKEIPERNIFLTLFILFIGLSPIMTSSVAWISARKHLLSSLFVLLATNELLNMEIDKKVNWNKITFLYILSILSQPINICWPLFVWIYLQFKKQKEKQSLYILIGIMIIFSLANWYYFNIYIVEKGYIKVQENNFLNFFINALNVIGRAFYLVILPTKALPAPHEKDSMDNFLGLILFFLCIVSHYFYSRKSVYGRKTLLFWPYFIVSLAPILLVNTIFISDTYLINASVGIYLIAWSFVNKQLILRIVFTIYFVYVATYNWSYVDLYTSSKKIWHYVYNKEQTVESALNVSRILTDERKFDLALEVIKYSQDDPKVAPYFYKLVILSPSIDREKKFYLIKNNKNHLLAQKYYLAKLYFESHQKEMLKIELRTIVKEKYLFNWMTIPEKIEAQREIINMCNFVKLEGCEVKI